MKDQGAWLTVVLVVGNLGTIPPANAKSEVRLSKVAAIPLGSGTRHRLKCVNPITGADNGHDWHNGLNQYDCI